MQELAILSLLEKEAEIEVLANKWPQEMWMD